MCTGNNPCMFHVKTGTPTPTRAAVKLTLADLVAIRRKVDKATKRADELQREWQQAGASSLIARYVLGRVTLPARVLAKTLDLNMGCDLTIEVLKGEYSPIFPASIGISVAYLKLPQVVAVDAFDAAWVTRPPRHCEDPLSALADVQD